MLAAPEIQEPISKLTVMTAGEGFIRVGELCNLQYFTGNAVQIQGVGPCVWNGSNKFVIRFHIG